MSIIGLVSGTVMVILGLIGLVYFAKVGKEDTNEVDKIHTTGLRIRAIILIIGGLAVIQVSLE